MRPPNDDLAAAKAIQVERMCGLAHLVHHVIGYVSNVVDRALTDRFQPADQPGRRRTDPHPLDYSSRVPWTESRVGDFYRSRLVRGFIDFDWRARRRNQGVAVQQRSLASNAKMGQAVRPVRPYVEIHDVIVAKFFHGIDRQTDHRQPPGQLVRL